MGPLLALGMDYTLIKDLKSITKNVNVLFIVLEVSSRIATTKEGHEIRTCKVADRSACINFVLFGELGAHIQPGDICRLTRAYVGTWNGSMALYAGKGGELVKTGDFCMIFNENLNMSEINKIIKPPTTTNATASPMATNVAPGNNNNSTPVIELDG